MEVIGADVLVALDVQVVVVTLQEGGEGELEGRHHQVSSQDDSHPLTGNLHEVFRLSPGKIQYMRGETGECLRCDLLVVMVDMRTTVRGRW